MNNINFAKTPLDRLIDTLIYILLLAICLITVYPLVYVLSMSISEPEAVLRQEVWLYPIGFSIASYELIMGSGMFWLAYGNTLWYVIVGTIINMVLTLSAAYVLSVNVFFAKKFFMVMFVITMFFSGGLIPLFLQVNRLGLYDTRWAIVLPAAVSTWNLIIARTYFKMSIPEGVTESAKIDGANDLLIFLRIVLPVSKPIIAVLVIFYAVAHWNSWFTANIFLASVDLHPLQLFLRRMLLTTADPFAIEASIEHVAAVQQMKFASIVISTLPILCIYPFFQKHFVKGIMLGSLKG